jgi:hypothetical protein
MIFFKGNDGKRVSAAIPTEREGRKRLKACPGKNAEKCISIAARDKGALSEYRGTYGRVKAKKRGAFGWPKQSGTTEHIRLCTGDVFFYYLKVD